MQVKALYRRSCIFIDKAYGTGKVMDSSLGQVYLSTALCSSKSSEESRVVIVDCTVFGLGHAHLSELCAIAWQQVRMPGKFPLSSTADGSHCTMPDTSGSTVKVPSRVQTLHPCSRFL